MSYSFNGSGLVIEPTLARWIARQEIGISGSGHAVYPSTREFEMVFVLNTQAEFSRLQGFFDAVNFTGTTVAELPQYGASTYTFFRYSGCVLREPNMEAYFTQHPTNVRLLITNIRT